ncbi:MAG TPA: DegQ family serine endoprotease, partial [Vicinamibacterales bacterium]
NNMDKARYYLSQRAVRAGIAVAASALLVVGATWHGFAANALATSPLNAPQSIFAAQSAPSTSSRVLAGGRESYADVVKVVAPGVVTIQVEGKAQARPTQFGGGDDEDMLRRFFGDQFGFPGDQGDRGGRGDRGQRGPRTFKQRGLGSGVIVSPDGYILTNNHVVDSADDIRVELTDGRTLKAKLVGADKPSDLALLKVEGTNLPTVAVGNSDAAQVGDVVLAVGNPLGIGQTVTMGIISAKGRSTGNGDGSYEDFIQTDAPINHGNSGGALVNLRGELVGINSQILSQSDGNIGIGFAIPSNMARHVMDDLRKDGKVRRSQLGVTIQPVTSDLADSLNLKQVGGVIVSSVTADSAADHAGMKRGDVIKSFNGQPVQDMNSLRNHVADMTPGSNASVVIVRDGSEKTLNVKLDEASGSRAARDRDDSSGSDDKAALGIQVAPLTPDMAAEAKLPRNTHGVVVQNVNPDGRAADAGIKEGDIILEVNRQAVQSVDDLRAAVRRSSDRPTLLLVNRDGRDIFVTVRPS